MQGTDNDEWWGNKYGTMCVSGGNTREGEVLKEGESEGSAGVVTMSENVTRYGAREHDHGDL